MTFPELHVITDETVQNRLSHIELAQRLADSDVDVIQFREKRSWKTEQLLQTAHQLQHICSASKSTKLIVNDRVDVSVACGSYGVHLGAHDLPKHTARHMLGDNITIGGTANSITEAERVWMEPINYLGIGPVFGTSSKASIVAPLGLPTLTEICSRSPLPVIAIGNITLENLPSVLDCGVRGVAVLSDILCADDPGVRAMEFLKVLRSQN